MSTEVFKKIVSECVAKGINDFELTPVVGEFFLDSECFEKLYYLENHPLVKNYDLYTNLINMSEEEVVTLSELSKLNLVVSIHGWDRDSFLEFTNRDKYEKFAENFRVLIKTCLGHINLNRSVTIAYHEKPKGEFKTAVLALASTGVDIEEINEFSNWGVIPQGTLAREKKVEKVGICEYAIYLNGINTYGDVTLCSCHDINYELRIGNIFHDNFEKIYADDSLFTFMIEQQSNGNYDNVCKRCNEFKKIDDKLLEKASKDIPSLGRFL
jgi:radical SAM protein with 4Fe4S-binding SPASM domain